MSYTMMSVCLFIPCLKIVLYEIIIFLTSYNLSFYFRCFNLVSTLPQRRKEKAYAMYGGAPPPEYVKDLEPNDETEMNSSVFGIVSVFESLLLH